ncbi:septum formation initiator [Streptomyces sp. DT24]|uniref:septum formation initiator n=1 Tax=unclassified Streptomyces TaxID=2593676 RepID=UPI0023B9F833|nr:septum formation initiator [Streptomyces sp. AM 4-1-1]WEH32948.1 septum formation initiator [Streptomyces sp. AM 4-1-1]
MSKQAGQLKGRAARLTRMLPAGSGNAARTPFVLLVVLLLGGGLITLLVLNSALNEGSFRLSELKKRTTELTDEQQALQRDVDGYSEPDALEQRARGLGMVPGGSPAFLGRDGKVRGMPSPAAAPEPTPSPTGSVPASPPALSGSGAADVPANGTPAQPSADPGLAPDSGSGPAPDASSGALAPPSPTSPGR